MKRFCCQSEVNGLNEAILFHKYSVLHRPSGLDQTSEFEHSLIAATLKKIFNLKEFLTKRDAWAGSFDIVVNRNTPRTDCPGN